MKSKNLSDSILKTVKSNGFKYIELPSVIEANHIVQRSGESFRKFIFSFTDQGGNELCLRPDLTIVSCLRYLENNLKGKEKIFYNGQDLIKVSKKVPYIRNIAGKSEVHIGGFSIDSSSNSLRVICVLDNLLKGAATQAIQNTNYLLGLNELTGINNE